MHYVFISFFISVEFYNIKTEYLISATWISIERYFLSFSFVGWNWQQDWSWYETNRSTFGYIKAKTLIGLESLLVQSILVLVPQFILIWFRSVLWRNIDGVAFNDHMAHNDHEMTTSSRMTLVIAYGDATITQSTFYKSNWDGRKWRCLNVCSHLVILQTEMDRLLLVWHQ